LDIQLAVTSRSKIPILSEVLYDVPQ